MLIKGTFIKQIYKRLQYISALLIIDIIGCTSNDFVDFTVDDKYIIYKWHLPFNATLDTYKFIKANEYNTKYNN